MILGSTSRNINILTICTFIGGIVGWVFVDFTMSNILLMLISFYVLNIIGVWMMLHRYYSHKSFEFRFDLLKWIFTLLTILAGRGSPLGWVYLHRKHHRYSDTDKDPHSPKILGYQIFGGFSHYQRQEEEQMAIFLVKDLMTPAQLFIHKWYMAILVTIVVIFGIIDFQSLYFMWVLPMICQTLIHNHFNYFGHMSGYRNFVTKDDSRNNVFLFPFILGEAWHNNHHNNPSAMTTRVKWWEIDPLSYVILLISKR